MEKSMYMSKISVVILIAQSSYSEETALKKDQLQEQLSQHQYFLL